MKIKSYHIMQLFFLKVNIFCRIYLEFFKQYFKKTRKFGTPKKFGFAKKPVLSSLSPIFNSALIHKRKNKCKKDKTNKTANYCI